MASIRLTGISKSFGDHNVIPSIDLDILDREFVVFVGPSGCGKSTLLRIIAGLEPVDAGDVFIGDRRVNDIAPADRDIAMVFQDYALYPHMSVYTNMAFALQMRNMPRDEIDRRVRKVAATLRLDEYLDRKPRALSGGQRQRVAMGRAMVRNPQAFLFDEPLSNLDAKLRAEVRTEIKALAQQLRTTMVFVTHDQVEAMTMADRIVILRAGHVQQVGTPEEVYNRPANQFVAGFIGSPSMNFFPVRLDGDVVRMSNGAAARLDANRVERVRNVGDKPLVLGVRPEHLLLRGSSSREGLGVTLSVVEPLGSDTLLYFELDGTRHVARVPPEQTARPGDRVTLDIAVARAHVFDSATGAVLA